MAALALAFRVCRLLGWRRSIGLLSVVAAAAWLFGQRRRRRAAANSARSSGAPAPAPSRAARPWTRTRIAATIAGAVFFLAVGGLHGITATAASSMAALAVLWLFAPAPLVFLARAAGLLNRFRKSTAAYLGVSAALSMVVLFGVGWIGADRGLYPAPPDDLPVLDDYPALASALEEVTFPSADGITLAGWFVPGESPTTIVLMHGFGENRNQMLPHADFLHEAGYSTLLFDLRSRGESEGDAVTFGYHERGDLRGALRYLEQRPDADAESVGVLGMSMGGAAAIMAAADLPQVKAVVSESAFQTVNSAVDSSFEYFINLPAFPFSPVTVFIMEQRLGIKAGDIRPVEDVGRISPRAVFIIHGADDVTVVPEDGVALHAAAGEPKEPLWLIEGAGHAAGIETAPLEYEARVLDFFERHLPR